jgi:hypothetical protein
MVWLLRAEVRILLVKSPWGGFIYQLGSLRKGMAKAARDHVDPLLFAPPDNSLSRRAIQNDEHL